MDAVYELSAAIVMLAVDGTLSRVNVLVNVSVDSISALSIGFSPQIQDAPLRMAVHAECRGDTSTDGTPSCRVLVSLTRVQLPEGGGTSSWSCVKDCGAASREKLGVFTVSGSGVSSPVVVSGVSETSGAFGVSVVTSSAGAFGSSGGVTVSVAESADGVTFSGAGSVAGVSTIGAGDSVCWTCSGGVVPVSVPSANAAGGTEIEMIETNMSAASSCFWKGRARSGEVNTCFMNQ